MAQLFSNNVDTTLASSLSDVATSAALTDGAGLQSPTGGDYELLTLAAAGNYEIVRVTARSTNTVTITRAQEGTTARNWSAGTRVFAGVTAGTLSGLGGLQNAGTGTNAIALGTGALAAGTEATAYGQSTDANANYSLALGTGSVANGAYSSAIGPYAQADIDDALIMSGMPAIPRNTYTASSAVSLHSSSGAIVTSGPLNLRTAQVYEIPMPTNMLFFPDEVGLVFIFQQNGAIDAQPTVQFGINGTVAQYLDPVATTGLLVPGDRWRATSLKTNKGATTLRFEITVAATALDWGSLNARVYWRGFAMEWWP